MDDGRSRTGQDPPEFKEQYHSLDQASQNHEQGYSTQETFRKNVTNMCDAIVTLVNPSHEPMMLCKHDCMDAMDMHALHTIEMLVKEQYCKYGKDVLVDRHQEKSTTTSQAAPLHYHKLTNKTIIPANKEWLQSVHRCTNHNTKLEEFFKPPVATCTIPAWETSTSTQQIRTIALHRAKCTARSTISL